MSPLKYRVSHKRRPISQILKVDISIILPSSTSLSTSGIFLIFEKRASYLGNPVYLAILLDSGHSLVELVVCAKDRWGLPQHDGKRYSLPCQG